MLEGHRVSEVALNTHRAVQGHSLDYNSGPLSSVLYSHSTL